MTEFEEAVNINPAPDTTITAPGTNEIKQARIDEWKKSMEAELQQLITDAAALRKIISESKTQTKKNFYSKKFKQINNMVLHRVDLLQKLDKLDHVQPIPEKPSPNETTHSVTTI